MIAIESSEAASSNLPPFHEPRSIRREPDQTSWQLHVFCRVFLFLLLCALLPATVRADAILNECSQPALESALGVGGVITVNCDGTLVLSNTVTVASDAVLDATGHRLTISSL